MNHPDNLSGSQDPAVIAVCTDPAGREARHCARPHCHNVVTEPWDETGTLCASCAIENDLSDREGRWDRCFPTVH